MDYSCAFLRCSGSRDAPVLFSCFLFVLNETDPLKKKKKNLHRSSCSEPVRDFENLIHAQDAVSPQHHATLIIIRKPQNHFCIIFQLLTKLVSFISVSCDLRAQREQTCSKHQLKGLNVTVLSQKCLTCHALKKMQGDFLFESRLCPYVCRSGPWKVFCSLLIMSYFKWQLYFYLSETESIFPVMDVQM